MSGSENDTLTKVAVWPGLIPPADCARAIAIAKEYTASPGRVGSEDAEDSGIRRSDIWFLGPAPDTDFLFAPLRAAVEHLNRGFGFDIGDFAEGCQIAHYTADLAGHYDWHMDLGTGRFSRRKISMSVQLSDPDSYDGGDLEFHMSGLNRAEMRQQGTMIAFPSFLEHRVTPVTRGERYSLVVWVDGPPYH